MADTDDRPDVDWLVASVVLAGGAVTDEARAVFDTFSAPEKHRAIDRLTDAGCRAAAESLAHPPAGMPIDAAVLLAESADDDDYDWLVAGLIERRDRIIVTGEEGGGKSTFLRVVGLRLACGLHPFGDRAVDPLRVLVIDAENSRRQVRRGLRRLWAAAEGRYRPGGFLVMLRPDGVNLADKTERDELLLVVGAARPDLIIIGPLYKLAGGDPIKEEAAKAAADTLAALRDVTDAALLIEAHTPHAQDRGPRPKRPYGASLWLRWPEFGLHLAADGAMTHWRGPRDERSWPHKLRRGGPWLWELDPDVGSSRGRVMDAVLAVLKATTEATALSGRQVTAAVGGRMQDTRDTLAALVADPSSGVRSRVRAGRGGGLVFWFEEVP